LIRLRSLYKFIRWKWTLLTFRFVNPALTLAPASIAVAAGSHIQLNEFQ
jgi:hypothetical protein